MGTRESHLLCQVDHPCSHQLPSREPHPLPLALRPTMAPDGPSSKEE